MLDIDECDLPETCTQLCENKKGGFKCSCRAGYEWDQVDQSCRALGKYQNVLYIEAYFGLFYILRHILVRVVRQVKYLILETNASFDKPFKHQTN